MVTFVSVAQRGDESGSAELARVGWPRRPLLPQCPHAQVTKVRPIVARSERSKRRSAPLGRGFPSIFGFGGLDGGGGVGAGSADGASAEGASSANVGSAGAGPFSLQWDRVRSLIARHFLIALSTRRAGHVDAFQDDGERGGINGDLGLRRLHRWDLKTALLQPARSNEAPSAGVEEEQLHHDPTPVKEQIQVAILRPKAVAAGDADQGVEETAHVDGLHGEEDPNHRREAQHARTARRSPVRVASSKLLSSSIGTSSTVWC